MANIREKDMSKGVTLVTCNICGEKLLGQKFFNNFKNGKLSRWQKIQIKAVNKLSKMGAKVLGMELEDSPRSTLLSLLTLHLTRKSARVSKEHAKVLAEITKRMDDFAVLSENYTMDRQIQTFLSPPETLNVLVPSKRNE